MSNNILEIKNLSKIYSVKKKWGQSNFFYAVQDLNLAMGKGSCLGLVGESGCGKSTVARMMVGLLAPSKGEVFIDDELVFSASLPSKKAYPEKIQMVFQDPFSSLNPRICIGRSIAEPLLLSDKSLSRKHIKEKAISALVEVGLEPSHYTRFPHEFSGGQRQRVALARALITRPQIVVCDEPVSALDASVQAQALNLMRDIQKKLGISYVFISHDLHVVAYMSDEIAIMYCGQIVEKASKEIIFSKPAHPYTKALMDAAPSLNQHHREFVSLQGEPPSPFNPPKGCPFHPRCPYVQKRCMEEIPQEKEIEQGHTLVCHFPLLK